ncbi:MAG: PEP-utilizing enzyme [Candidatus Paceibacterota bacterium]|jgi:pyruvate,water dikinase
MKTDQKIEWEFLMDRAYMPLSYSLNAFSASRRRVGKYLDISDQKMSGQIFYPNDIFWIKGFTPDVTEKQIEHHKKEGNGYLWRMAKTCEDRGDKLIVDLKNRISRDSVKGLSRQELESLFAWAIEEIRDFSAFLTIPWAMEGYLDTLMMEIVNKAAKEDRARMLAELLLPLKTNSSAKETPAILELAIEIIKDQSLRDLFESERNIEDELVRNNHVFLGKIDDFIAEYGWIHVRWFKGTPITRKSVIERLQVTVSERPEEKLRELEAGRDKIMGFVNDFITTNSLGEKEKDTILLVKEYVFIRTYRTDTLSQAFYLLSPIIKKTAEFLGLTIDEALYHSEAELRKKLRGEELGVDVEARKEMWAIFILNDTYEIYSGREAVEKLKREQGLSRDIEDVSEVKGQTAFKGNVSGRVKIVLDPNDISKVERGDVMVAVMTFPSYIVAMERAAAFVTDDGGILCHASISAREMKKPCVISTKIATKIFKDGDLVEVDADNGIVRIVERK